MAARAARTWGAVVNALPPRAVKEGEIVALGAELRALEERGGAAALRLELRSKQCALLVHSLLDLTAVLREEGEEDTAGDDGTTEGERWAAAAASTAAAAGAPPSTTRAGRCGQKP